MKRVTPLPPGAAYTVTSGIKYREIVFLATTDELRNNNVITGSYSFVPCDIRALGWDDIDMAS